MNRGDIHIDLDTILETAEKGVRRAAVFVGLGINAARDPNFRNYSLREIAAIELIPSQVAPEKIEDFKATFSQWVIGCGLRELIETFSVFLDQVYEACMLVFVVKSKTLPDDAKKFIDSFRWRSLEVKLNEMKEKFGIGPDYPEFIIAIQRVRNCLTHRRGLVSSADSDENGVLVLEWRGIDFLVTQVDGKEIRMESPLKEPIVVEEGGKIGVRFANRRLEFSVGSTVDIPPKVIAELGLFMSFEAKKVIGSTIEFFRRSGVEVQLKGGKTSIVEKG